MIPTEDMDADDNPPPPLDEPIPLSPEERAALLVLRGLVRLGVLRPPETAR